jgi:hypothetical protein
MAKCCPWGRVGMMGENCMECSHNREGKQKNNRIINKRGNRKITKEEIKIMKVEVKQMRNKINLRIIIIKKGKKGEN